LQCLAEGHQILLPNGPRRAIQAGNSMEQG